jgi:hypothetical protein
VPRRAEVAQTAEFRRWMRGLDPEIRGKVDGAINRVVATGPTLGRPHVDTIHGSRLAKLKEMRIDRSTRVLFAFDSDRRPVMLVGGDKRGKWNRWYPGATRNAERLLADHERRIGRGARWQSRRPAARVPPHSR